MKNRGFGSDNYSGVHPLVLTTLSEASCGHAAPYANDEYTAVLEDKFKEMFGEETQTFLVYNGTGANILAISAFMQSYEAVVSAQSAHINVDECGALEVQLGSKIMTIPSADGKITVEGIKSQLGNVGDQHRTQPRVVSISQPTELGTLYTPEEIKEIADFAHANDLYLHMDGARFANAVAALGCTPADITTNVGVDALSFGGTKNGMMFGEAVLFFNKQLPKQAKYLRKQQMQLHSKGRFIASQFLRMLQDDLWLSTASHSNRMAALMAREVSKVESVQLCFEPQTNQLFAVLPKDMIEPLKEHGFFYTWNEDLNMVRWVCSFDTQIEDITKFVEAIKMLSK